MITINYLRINEDATQIDVTVSTTVGNTITQVLLWDIKTFKVYSQAIDLSHLLTGGSETETFSIPASELNLEYLSGIFFLEFKDSDSSSNSVLGVASNFIKYHECLLEKVLKIDLEGCIKKSDNCDNCNKNIFSLSTLINALTISIQHGFYEEAARISNVVEDMCDICYLCPDYKNTKLINGLGFGTFDNSIRLL